MSRFAASLVPHPVRFGAMPLEQRRKILPERNVCSLSPSKDYADCISTGNGSHRIEVLGDPYVDELTVTQEALYYPRWAKTPEPPDLAGVMPEVRALLRAGKFVEAAELVEKKQVEAGFNLSTVNGAVMPVWSLSLHPAFRLGVRQPEAGSTWNYLRWVDLLTGKLTVQWEDTNGAFSRETFAAYQGDMVVLRFHAPPGAIDAEITIKPPETGGMGFFNAPPFEKCTHELAITDGLLTLTWAYNPEHGRKGYVSVIRFVRGGGKAERTADGIRVAGADNLILLCKTVKVEGGFTFDLADPIVAALLAVEPDFDALLASNRRHLGSRIERSRLRLGGEDGFALSSEELLQRTHTSVEIDGTLMDKLYDMGRFYQITDTGRFPPMWGQHNINTNLQVCAGNSTGLFDEMDVYFRYYETKFEDFRTNARKLFGARGLLASVHCDYDSGLYYHFSKTYPHYCWTGCLGWIYNELWGYWLVTGDKDFLRVRIVPALKEIALFYEDYACDRGPDGRVIFYPSFSPENPTPEYATRGGSYAASINSVMDIMICREVLDNLVEACNVLGIERESIGHWQAQRESLPRYLLDEEGGLKEWAWPTVNENHNHRHVSHHYDLWPGRVVTWEDEPELARAIQISNRKRGQQDDSAHGIIHRCLSAIRLKDVPETVHNLYQLMNHGFVTRGLQTMHYPYRVRFPDLQGAMPAILLEMCVYSAPGTVEFLPALPASLGTGRIEGVWLYTWAKLERLEWSESGLTASIVSNKPQTLTLRCRRHIASFRVDGMEKSVDGNHIQHPFAGGDRIEVAIDF